MKILVCISKVPDTTTKISFVDNDTKFNEDKVQFIVNPYDEWYALVRALEITEKSGGTVTIINVGPADNDQIIRKALAIGANDSVRIDGNSNESFYVASQIAEYAKTQGYDIVMTGKETIDYNGAEVGGMIAELMNVPYVSHAGTLDVEGGKATMKRSIEGGYETVEVTGTFVVSCQKGMAEARIPNMRGIMAARTKPLTVVAPVNVAQLTSVKAFTLPPAKAAVKMISPDNVSELVNLLHTEAKVI